AGAGPLGAWERIASRTAFRFPPDSQWVAPGRDAGLVRGRGPLVLDDEQRITAPAGGVLRARSAGASRPVETEWALAPGQSVVLHSGDRLDPRALPPRVSFEAGKRVPGAPPSGMAWAAGRRVDWWSRAGLGVTLVLGAFALLRAGATEAPGRSSIALLGGGLVAALLWAHGWASYALLAAPDLLLGAVTPDRLLDLSALTRGAGAPTAVLEGLLLAAGVASFLASSLGLAERLASIGGGGRAPGRDAARWA